MIRRKNLSFELIQWLKDLGGLQPGFGELHFLCTSASGVPYLWLQEQGINSDNLHITLPAAYAALTAGRNDTLIVMPGSHTLTAKFAWSKDYTNMIGATAPNHINSRARFVCSTITATMTPLCTFGANGSIMKNVMWSQEGAHATYNAVPMLMTGGRNYLESVTCRNLHATAVTNASKRDLVMSSSNGENLFKNCTFGADTYDGSADTVNYNLEFATNDYNGRNQFDSCWFLGSGSAGASFIYAPANTLNSFNLFKECMFYNNVWGSMNAMTQAFSIEDSDGDIILMDCLVKGAATYQTSNTNNLLVRHAYAAATSDVAVVATF